MKELYKQILDCFLPEELVENFDVTDIVKTETTLNIYMSEKNIQPPHDSTIVMSPNGFTEYSVFTDFPVRRRLVTIHARKRRWIAEDIKTKQKTTFSKEYSFVAEGTRISKNFATFLKGTRR